MAFFPDYFASIADYVQTVDTDLSLQAANGLRQVSSR